MIDEYNNLCVHHKGNPQYIYCQFFQYIQSTHICCIESCLTPLCGECINQHNVEHKNQKVYPEVETLEQTKSFCFERIANQLKCYNFEISRIQSIQEREYLEEDKGVELIQNCHQKLQKILFEFFKNLESEFKQQMQKKQTELLQLKYFQEKMNSMVKDLDLYFIQFQNIPNPVRQLREFLITDYELEFSQSKLAIDDFLESHIQSKKFLKCNDDKIQNFLSLLNQYICIYQQSYDIQITTPMQDSQDDLQQQDKNYYTKNDQNQLCNEIVQSFSNLNVKQNNENEFNQNINQRKSEQTQFPSPRYNEYNEQQQYQHTEMSQSKYSQYIGQTFTSNQHQLDILKHSNSCAYFNPQEKNFDKNLLFNQKYKKFNQVQTQIDQALCNQKYSPRLNNCIIADSKESHPRSLQQKNSKQISDKNAILQIPSKSPYKIKNPQFIPVKNSPSSIAYQKHPELKNINFKDYQSVQKRINDITNTVINYNIISEHKEKQQPQLLQQSYRQQQYNQINDLNKPFLILNANLLDKDQINIAQLQIKQYEQLEEQQNKENIPENFQQRLDQKNKFKKVTEVDELQDHWLLYQKNIYDKQKLEKLKQLHIMDENQNADQSKSLQTQNQQLNQIPTVLTQQSIKQQSPSQIQNSYTSQQDLIFNYNNNIAKQISDNDFKITLKDYFRPNSQHKLLHFFQPKSNFLHLFNLEQYLPQKSQQYQFEKIQLQIDFKIPRWSKSLITPMGDIFLTGGVRIEEPQEKLNTIYYLDFNRKTLLPLQPMNTARSGHAFLFLKNELYEIGGCGKDNQYLKCCEKYQLKTSQWVSIANLNLQANNPCSCTFDNKFIIKIGGKINETECNNIIEKYDPQHNTWEILQTNINQGRVFPNFKILSQSASIQINNSQILVLGGCHENSNQKSNQVYLIDLQNQNQLQILHPNIKNMPLSEGFWNENPIIWNQELFCIQNICNEQNSSAVYLDRRKVLKFNKQKQWEIII